MNVIKMSTSLFAVSFLFAPSAHAAIQWTHVTSGAAFSVASSEVGTWVVGTDRNVYAFLGYSSASGFSGWFRETSGQSVAQIAASQQNRNVWVLDTSGRIGQFDTTGSSITYLPTGVGESIAVNNANNPFVQGTDGQLWEWANSSWNALGGVVHNVVVWDIGGLSGIPFVLGSDDNVWYDFMGWSAFSPSAGATLLADHVVVGRGFLSNVLIEYSDTQNTWTPVGSPPVNGSSIVQISSTHQVALNGGADDVDHVWLVDNTQNIYEGHPLSSGQCDWYSPFDNKTFPASVQMVAHSGSPIGITVVQLDFWGAFYANPNNRATIQNDAANVFGGSPGSSRFWAKTAEYGANLGFLGSVANNKGTTDGAGFTKASIEAGIRSDIANHSIIGGTSGAVVVVLPTDSTYRDSSGAAECAGCGHHDSFINPDTNQRVNYATVSTSTDEKQTMYALSHEVAEIATDPDQSGFWAPQVPGSTRNGTLENGDLCQNMRDTVNGSPSALTWSQAYCGCL